MNNLQQFIKLDYYLNPRPTYVAGEFLFYAIFFAIILVVAIILKKFFDSKSKSLKPYNFFREKFFSSFITCVIIGFVLLFFRWEYLYYLSSRILLIITFIITLIFLTSFIIYRSKRLPKEVEEFTNRQNYQKYIPQQKTSRMHPSTKLRAGK